MLEAHTFLEVGRWLVRDERRSIDSEREVERPTHLAFETPADDGARQHREIAEGEHAETHEQPPALVAQGKRHDG
jgi:hypothetical protein